MEEAVVPMVITINFINACRVGMEWGWGVNLGKAYL